MDEFARAGEGHGLDTISIARIGTPFDECHAIHTEQAIHIMRKEGAGVTNRTSIRGFIMSCATVKE